MSIYESVTVADSALAVLGDVLGGVHVYLQVHDPRAVPKIVKLLQAGSGLRNQLSPTKVKPGPFLLQNIQLSKIYATNSPTCI